ncbi:MAG TPA: hypothetical protein VF618_13705 [Thermoanaerobaculia bacterium]
MLKPVSILALDDTSAMLGAAVAARIAAACGLEDLVQSRRAGAAPLADTVDSIHARRQAAGNPLRKRDDIGNREVVLVIVSASQHSGVVAVARELRELYDMRRLAEFYTIELLCLLPAVGPSPDYGAAYSLFKLVSAEKCFDEVWLLDAANDNRFRLGPIAEALDGYAQAVAGSLLFDPELSGAPAAHRPRGMEPAFSSFGYAELVFPRDVALQRLEAALSEELVRATLLKTVEVTSPPKLVSDEFEVPFTLFSRFQPKTFVDEKTRSAEEIIAAVRHELKAHRETIHERTLQTLKTQGDEAVKRFTADLSGAVDASLDRHDYRVAIRQLDALIEPLAARNLVTQLHAAAASLDARLQFTPDTAKSDERRKRLRELENLFADQKLVAEVHDSQRSSEQLAQMESEQAQLRRELPDVIFAEEKENNRARNEAIDAETKRLADDTAAREQQLRELFAQLPRAEQTLREMLDDRRTFLWTRLFWTLCGFVGLFHSFGLALVAVGTLGAYSVVQYFRNIAPRVLAAREQLERLREQLQGTDKAKNAAHNAELQFEYDVAHRRTTLSLLGQTRAYAETTLNALRERLRELEACTFERPAIRTGIVSTSIIDEADVDAWYERTRADRKLLFLDFPIARSASRHLSMETLRQRISAYVATAFKDFRQLTLAQATSLTSETALAQRLKLFLEASAPLIELTDDDLQAQQTIQRDATLWIDTNETSLLSTLQRRLPGVHARPTPDPLRVHALTRTLHYPAYVLGQFDYYRSKYDPAQHPESAKLPDLRPLPPPVRLWYEQVLLGRATGILRVRNGKLRHATTILGDSHLDAAERLAATAELRRGLETALAPRLTIAENVARELQELARTDLSALDREVLAPLLKRYEVV